METNKQEVVLILGSVMQEGIQSVLHQMGRKHIVRNLHSNPTNWENICDVFQEYEVTLVLAKLSSYTYRYFSDAQYDKVGRSLLSLCSQTPNAFFIHEDVRNPEETQNSKAEVPEENWEDDDDNNADEQKYSLHIVYASPTDEVREKVNGLLAEYSLDVYTYRRNSEITFISQRLLESNSANLLFRAYIPNQQLWSNEADRFLDLFVEYLTKITDTEIRTKKSRTNNGYVYEIYGKLEGGFTLSSSFEDFENIIKYCAAAPEQAEKLLKARNIKGRETIDVITRFAKEAQRLRMDMRHELEQKTLRIRHRLESELSESTTLNEFDVLELADVVIPTAIKTQSILSLMGGIPDRHLPAPRVSDKMLSEAKIIALSEISGDVNFGPSDKQLVELFQRFGDQQATQLMSYLRELKDNSIPTVDRRIAKGRIFSFLQRLGSKGIDVTIDLAQKYIAKKFLDL